MAPLYFVLVIGALVVVARGGNSLQTREDEHVANALAQNMLVQQRLAAAYAASNPTATGVIPLTALSAPTAYRSSGGWVSVVAGGKAATYAPTPQKVLGGPLVKSLRTTAHDGNVGISEAGGLIHNLAGQVVPLPAGVPVGVVTMVTP